MPSSPKGTSKSRDSSTSKESSSSHYSPPWADVCIIGIAGSSGSGKSSLSHEIVSQLNLPWVVILSMDSYYKTLTLEQSKRAFNNDWDFDHPNALDFDILVDCLRELKAGKRAEIPVYSFAKHQRQKETTSIYSPHILILEGIFALYDQRILDLLDMRIFCNEDADICLSRRILRDVAERGRDIEGVIKQWAKFVKPNFEQFVDRQQKVADIIVPRGIENRVAITMVTQYIERKLKEKSSSHRSELRRLGQQASPQPLSNRVRILPQTPQTRGMHTILQDRDTPSEEFIFYFDRMVTLLIENAMNDIPFTSTTITTPTQTTYHGLTQSPSISALILLRGGSALETGLKRTIPDCVTGRILIQSNIRTGEPELHYLKLPPAIEGDEAVLVLDAQMSSGGAALMAVQVLVDHGVEVGRIVFVTYLAGAKGLGRLCKVFPGVRVVVCEVVEEEERWVERRYFGC